MAVNTDWLGGSWTGIGIINRAARARIEARRLDRVERLTRRLYNEEEPAMTVTQCNDTEPHRPHACPDAGPEFTCNGRLGTSPLRWEGNMTLLERDTGEKPNLVCNSCPWECVDGWVEEYDSTICPDCDGLVVSKAAKKISEATARVADSRGTRHRQERPKARAKARPTL